MKKLLLSSVLLSLAISTPVLAREPEPISYKFVCPAVSPNNGYQFHYASFNVTDFFPDFICHYQGKEERNEVKRERLVIKNIRTMPNHFQPRSWNHGHANKTCNFGVYPKPSNPEDCHIILRYEK